MIKDDVQTLVDPEEWDDKTEGVCYRIREAIDSDHLVTYANTMNWVEKTTGNAGNQSYVHGQHIATWHKVRARLRLFPKLYSGLIATGGTGTDIPWKDG